MRLLVRQDDLLKPADYQGKEQTFTITLGEPTLAITTRLETNGLIPDALALQYYLIYSGLDKSLQAGEYQLSPGLTPVDSSFSMPANPGRIERLRNTTWAAWSF